MYHTCTCISNLYILHLLHYIYWQNTCPTPLNKFSTHLIQMTVPLLKIFNAYYSFTQQGYQYFTLSVGIEALSHREL